MYAVLRRWGVWVLVLALFGTSGPAAASETGDSQAALKALPPGEESSEGYLLQPGDRLTVKIYPEDEYLKGGEMEVSAEGNITLPLVGRVPVGGMTVLEAEKELVKIIDRDYIVNPEVVIDVLKYKKQSVVVLGQVKTPGTYEVPAGTTRVTLLQAISLAGGFSDIANIKKIKIMRTVGGKKEVLRANAEAIIGGEEEDVELEAGDVVHVMESLF